MILPDRQMQMLEEVREYLEAQCIDNVRIEITAKGITAQERSVIRKQYNRNNVRRYQ